MSSTYYTEMNTELTCMDYCIHRSTHYSNNTILVYRYEAILKLRMRKRFVVSKFHLCPLHIEMLYRLSDECERPGWTKPNVKHGR